MIELAVGPILALLISLKYSQQIKEKQDKQLQETSTNSTVDSDQE